MLTFQICLFWFAWTANRTSWVSPVIASGFFGLGLTWMFMPFLTYLPHAYPEYAASVLASNDFVRSMMGEFPFPPFTHRSKVIGDEMITDQCKVLVCLLPPSHCLET